MIHFLTNSWKKLKIMKSTLPKHSIWIQSEQKQGSPHHTQQTQHTAADTDSTWLAQTWQRSSADTWSVVPFVTTKLTILLHIYLEMASSTIDFRFYHRVTKNNFGKMLLPTSQSEDNDDVIWLFSSVSLTHQL